MFLRSILVKEKKKINKAQTSNKLAINFFTLINCWPILFSYTTPEGYSESLIHFLN
jgi:hypothetical protein